MKTTKIFSMILAIALVMTATAFAGETEKAEADKKPVELKNQTHCPVMGGKIDSSSYTDIQGQRVYHCCPMCTKALTEDPDKFFKKSAAEGVLFENIQASCPVSGETLEEKSVLKDFEGRRVYFCCEKCIAEFDKDPGKYLTAMDSSAKAKKAKEAKKKMTGHEGHNH